MDVRKERKNEHCDKMRQKGDVNMYLRLFIMKKIFLIAKKWNITYEKCVNILRDINIFEDFYQDVNGDRILNEEIDRLYKLKNSDNIKTILIEEDLMECLENDDNSWEFSEKFRNSI